MCTEENIREPDQTEAQRRVINMWGETKRRGPPPHAPPSPRVTAALVSDVTVISPRCPMDSLVVMVLTPTPRF